MLASVIGKEQSGTKIQRKRGEGRKGGKEGEKEGRNKGRKERKQQPKGTRVLPMKLNLEIEKLQIVILVFLMPSSLTLIIQVKYA